MRVLGQYVQVGDVLNFPVHRRKGQYVKAEVVRIQGSRAYDADGNTRDLPYDDHVTLFNEI